MPEKQLFTKASVAKIPLPIAGARVTVYDTKIPKLAVRVTHADTRTFYVVKRASGGMQWLRLGVFPGMTVEKARKAADSILGQFADGKDPAQAKREARATMTLGDAFELYMTRHVDAKKKKRGAELRQLWERCIGTLPDTPRKKHACERSKHPGGVDWQQRKITAISRDDVAGMHVAIGTHTPVLANRAIELLSAAYNKLADWGIAVDNPARGIEPFTEAKRDRFLQRGELPRFFSALANDTSDDFREFIALALLTGARRGNVLSMRWTDLDADGAAWNIPALDAKSGDAMRVPLVQEALAIIEARRERARAADNRSPFVFPATSKSGHVTAPKKRWAALFHRIELTEIAARIKTAGGEFLWANDGTESLERALVRARQEADTMDIDLAGARIADVRLHDLRRTLGSWQTILGASGLIVGKSLGHKSPSATAIYARLDMDPVRASVEAATSAMLVAGGVKKSAIVKKTSPRGRRA